MSEAPLSVERAGGAAWCTLDRPPLNLLEPGLIDAVRATFDALAADRVTRVAILTGGGHAFTAGMDVRVLRDLDTARAKDLITALHGAIDLATAVRYGINEVAAAYATDEPYQGMSAFLEKRAPKFGSSH